MRCAYLGVESGEEPPVHGEDLSGVLHRGSWQVGGITDVDVGVGASQVTQGRVNRVGLVQVEVKAHHPAWK